MIAIDQSAPRPRHWVFDIVFASMVIGAALAFVAGGVLMKMSDGLTQLAPTVGFLACFAVGASLQALAMRGTEMGVTYLVVVGLECVLAFGCGVAVFDERVTLDKVLGVILIIVGMLALRGTSGIARHAIRVVAAMALITASVDVANRYGPPPGATIEVYVSLAARPAGATRIEGPPAPASALGAERSIEPSGLAPERGSNDAALTELTDRSRWIEARSEQTNALVARMEALLARQAHELAELKARVAAGEPRSTATPAGFMPTSSTTIVAAAALPDVFPVPRDDVADTDRSCAGLATPLGQPIVLRFASRQSSLGTRHGADLRHAAALGATCPKLLVNIASYSDTRGSTQSNVLTSRRRAELVSAFLTRHHVSAARIRIFAYGGGSPVDSNKTEQGRERNRRVEITLSLSR